MALRAFGPGGLLRRTGRQRTAGGDRRIANSELCLFHPFDEAEHAIRAAEAHAVIQLRATALDNVAAPCAEGGRQRVISHRPEDTFRFTKNEVKTRARTQLPPGSHQIVSARTPRLKWLKTHRRSTVVIAAGVGVVAGMVIAWKSGRG